MSKSSTIKSINNSSAKWLYNKISKNMMSKSMLKTDLLHNKVLLYVVFAVSLINLLIWVVGGDIVNVILFMLVGFLTAFFSKNMIVILLFALVVSNIIKFGISIGKEGFSEGVDGEDDERKADGFEEDVEGLEEEEPKADGFEEDVEGLATAEDKLEDKPAKDAKKSVKSDEVKDAVKDAVNKDELKDEVKKDIANEKNEQPMEKPKKSETEGMHTLGYSFVANDSYSSSISNMIEQQNKLLSNISTLSPYVINADNESKLRSQMKYSEYVKH